jgi:thiol-disulfide isomerase/thioredoxin
VHLHPLCDPDALDDLLDAERRERRSVIFVGSHSCPPCNSLRPVYKRLARRLRGITFYDLNLDQFEDPAWEGWLTAVFKDLDLRYIPSQILLPVRGSAQVVRVGRAAPLRQALARLHRPGCAMIEPSSLLRRPRHAHSSHHRLLQRHRPRPGQRLPRYWSRSLGHGPQARGCAATERGWFLRTTAGCQ